MRDCPVCNGQLCYLGTLGRLVWLVCRACGMQCSAERSTFEPDTLPDDH